MNFSYWIGVGRDEDGFMNLDDEYERLEIYEEEESYYIFFDINFKKIFLY